MNAIRQFVRKYWKSMLFVAPIACIFFIFRNVIFYDNFFYNGDSLYSFFPYFYYKVLGGKIIAEQILSGFPVFVSVTGVWFYPLNKLASLIFSPLRAYVFLDISNILLTYLLTYWFFRKIKFQHVLAIFCAFVFVTSGQLMLWSETLTNTNYYFLLPAALLSIEYFFECKRSWTPYIAFVGLSFSLGTGWLSGHVQYTVYIHTFAAVYFLFHLFIQRENTKAFKIIQKIGILVGANIASFVIGLPQIMAILSYKSTSARSSGVGIKDFFEGSYFPQDILHYFLPFFKINGIPFSNPNLYIGILPFVLLILSFIYWKKIKENKFKFFSIVFLLIFLASFRYSPLGLFLHYLPFFNSFREAPRMMFIGSFAETVMIGYTFNFLLYSDYVTKAKMEKIAMIFKRALLFMVLPLVSLFTVLYVFFTDKVIALLMSYFENRIYAHTAHLSLTHYKGVIQQTVNSVFYQLSLFDIQIWILCGSIIVACIVFTKFKQYSPSKIIATSTLLTLFFTSAAYARYFKYISFEEINSMPNTAATILKREKDNYEPFRVFSIFPGLTLYNELGVRCNNQTAKENFMLQKELLQPNINILYNIDVIDGYDNFMSRSISEVLAKVGSEQSVTGNLLANENIPIEERIKKIVSEKDMLRMMNVKYVISHYEINDSNFTKIFEEKIGNCNTTIMVYELSHPWPRYFLTDQKINEIVDVHSNSQIVLPTFEYNATLWNITTDREQTLFIGNNYLPDYRATLDGKSVPIKNVNGIYMAVVIPKGTHKVALTYKLPYNPLQLK